MSEAGVTGYEFSTWYGLLVPGRTPAAIVGQLNGATARILATPALKEQFAGQGIEAASSSPAEFGTYLKSEVAKWGKVIKAANIKAE